MITGSCLCGAIAFEVDGRVTPVQLCHATRCRKASGSAFAAELAARTRDFRWLRGQELISVYEAPILHEPPPFRRRFCSRCGSPMPGELEGTDYTVIHAGTLDECGELKAFRHIFVGQNAPWFEIADALPRYEGRAPEAERLPARKG